MTSELARPRHEGCLSDLVFDEWHAGELAPEREREALAHLSQCAACSARRAELDRARAEFLERFPAPSRVAAASRGSSVVRFLRPAWLGGALAAAAALVLVVASLRGPRAVVDESAEHGTRTKGSGQLSFFVKHAGSVREGLPGERVHPGDQLRFVLRANRASHVAILSLDGAGTASVYYPSGAGVSRELDVSQGQALDSAIELDAVLGNERIVALFCAAPFELEPLRRELEATRALSAPAGCTLDELEIVKAKAR